MIEKDRPQAKKSLMNSLSKLEKRSNQLEDVAKLTFELIGRFEREDPSLMIKEEFDGQKQELIQEGIIGLLDNIDLKLERYLQLIVRNTEKVLDMIE